MGIPGFNSWFYSQNKQAYQSLQQTHTDHLYIDMNSVLHNVLRKADSYDKYHCLLHKRLDLILRLTNPRKSVMLAIDGPAPLAKLITQRERRKRSFSGEERKKERQENSSSNSSKKKKKPMGPRVVSSTALTPGTPFMHDVCVSCSYFICSRLASRKWQHLEFELSGPTVAGEGEVKILGRLARPRHEAAVNPTDTHLIVGDDADLILMALVSNTPRLHILNSAISPDNKLSDKVAVLSVDRLHAAWLKTGIAGVSLLPQQQQQQLSADVLLRLLGPKADLAVLAIMSSGNDYLPAIKGVPKLETLWDSYKKLRTLPQFANCSIITAVPTACGSSNGSSSNGSSSSSSKHCRDLAVEAELDTLMLAEVLAVASRGPSYFKQLQQRYQSAGMGGTAAAAAAGAAMTVSSSSSGSCELSREAAEALPWLKGLIWTMSMYFAGDCPDYRWTYSGRVPSVAGLAALAAAATAAMAAASDDPSSAAAAAAGVNGSSPHHKLSLGSFTISGTSTSSNGALVAWQAVIAAAAAELCGNGSSSSSSALEPLLPHVCTLALLPAGAQQHVPAAVQHLMTDQSPVYDMYATCDDCEEAAATLYEAQRIYNVIIDECKAVEAQISKFQQQQQQQPLTPEQQQQLKQLYTEQESLQSSRTAALAALNAAQDARRRHETAAHPEGVNAFDLARLEAAVAAVPAEEFSHEQRTLTQLSHSLLLRSGTWQQQQRGWQQQQQQLGYQPGRAFSTNGYQSGSNNVIPGQSINPPPPPVERFGHAFRSSGGYRPRVLRNVLLESATGCRVVEDADVTAYSDYMVLGTAAAVADTDTQPAATAAAGVTATDQQQQQVQTTNAAAGAALRAALKAAAANAKVKPTMQPAATAAAAAAAAVVQQDGPQVTPSTANADEIRQAAEAAVVTAKQLQQQLEQQQRRHGKHVHQRSRSSSPSVSADRDASTAAATRMNSAVKHPRRGGKTPPPPWRQQQQQQQQPAAGNHNTGADWSDQLNSSVPPAPGSVPLPSGLLGKSRNSAVNSGNSRWDTHAADQNAAAAAAGIGGSVAAAAAGCGETSTGPGPISMDYEYEHQQQQQQQGAGVAAQQAYPAQQYNAPQRQYQYQQQYISPQQQQQHYVQYQPPQQQQQAWYQPQPQYQQQYHPYPQQQCYQQQQYPYRQQQQQQVVYQPMRSVSPAAAAGSSVMRPVSYQPPAAPPTLNARQQHPGLHFPRP